MVKVVLYGKPRRRTDRSKSHIVPSMHVNIAAVRVDRCPQTTTTTTLLLSFHCVYIHSLSSRPTSA
ncbi:hypothetical protein BC938DRAFT_480647 [Jimgerdemannia flammicorona]|uniref:Uncharacterized protein n=1 Tax=Jimgerdemannia flammicorona TaxID=994334 RepID=A0A433QI15_9FUNG|nr:hypothetical protein BC938DRAFT_480647 [Jimgerdemannia flammicorona]